MGFCCGFVAGTDKHQLWCSEHPDRKKKAKMETQATTKPLSNSEQAVIDDIAKGVVAKLDADHSGWFVDEENKRLKNDDITVWVDGGAGKVVAWLKGAGKHYTETGNPSASQEHIWAGFKRWQERRYLANLTAKEAPAPVIPVEHSDPRWFIVTALALVGAVFMCWLGLVWWASRPVGPDGSLPTNLPPVEYAWYVVSTVLNFFWLIAGLAVGCMGAFASIASYVECQRWPFGKRDD